MSREIRRVPVDWKHPVVYNEHWRVQELGRMWRGEPRRPSRIHGPTERFVGLRSPSIGVAQREWDEQFEQWKAGTHEGLDFFRRYHSRDGFVDRDGERSFNPITLYTWSDDGSEVVDTEEFWVEDVDVSEERFFADHHWSRPDDPDERMPDFDVPEDELGWCLYETVSEGTPCTPVFATAEELVEHLCTIGEDYYQEPWDRRRAEAMVRSGWAPSGVSIGGQFYANADALVALHDAAAEG